MKKMWLLFAALSLIGIQSVPGEDVLPALVPDPAQLADNDVVKVPGPGPTMLLLRFSNGIANLGAGELHIVAYRDSASPSTVDLENDTIPAYQRILQSDGGFRDVPAGQLLYHPEHHHFHLDGAALYRLIDKVTGIPVRVSPKISFCLADVAEADATLPNFRKVPIYNGCIHDPYATFGEMGISVGWEDIYGKTLIGQAFDVTDLMQQNPAREYILESTTNPDRVLLESNPDPVSASVTIRLGVGVPVKVGKSRPGV
jgi:hypothetical protein